MRHHWLYLLAASAAFSAVGAGRTGSAQTPSVADPYRDEPMVFERYDVSTVVRGDGTGETTTHVVMRVQSEGTARQFAVLVFAYASANETGTIDFVRVRKPDGTVVETPVADAIEMPSEVTRNAPVYSDIREKHLPVRSLTVGDRLDYQFRNTRTSAEAPRQSWGAGHFMVNAGVVLQQTLTLTAPAATYIQVWSPHHPATPVTQDGVRVWKWTSSQTKPSQRDENGKMTAADVKDSDRDSDGRALPSVAWTTFHSWAEVGDWYRGLSQPRMEPTPAIRAKADAVTKDAKSPEEQVQALYRYVSTQTRYVGISLGVGRYQPHPAADVMANQYGDCKDKDTLLESLLRAKGFITAPALIGAGIVPVAEVPTPAVFNHVITTVSLPSGLVWLDSTPEVAPYRVLSPVIRDQEALVVPAKGDAALQKTPADPPFPYSEVFRSDMKLDDRGVLKGTVDLSIRSDAEFGYRALLNQLSPAQWDEGMQYVSNAMNFGGKVSHADLRQKAGDGPVHVRYDYMREDYADWKNNRIFANFPQLSVTTIDKDKAPDYDIDLGAPRTLAAHSEIALPEGTRAELPEPVHVKRDYMTFDKTYRIVDGKFVADRTVVVLKHKLPKDQWKEYLAFAKETKWDTGENYAVLISPVRPAAAVTSSTGATPPAGASSKAESTASATATSSVEDLLDEASVAFKREDWQTVRARIESAKQQSPDAPRVHAWAGTIAQHDKDIPRALEEYHAELRLYPDADTFPILAIASILYREKRFSEDEAELKPYLARDDRTITSAMIGAQIAQEHQDAALATTQAYLARHADDRDLRSTEGDLLRRLHRYPEAAAAARKAMEGSDDPAILNNNVYVLSQMKMDLPFAEEQSKRSIKLLEEKTAAYSVEEANSRAFADSANLTASWDTLGYILLLQDKTAEALPYLEAAWFNRQDIAVANHLAQTYERLGRPADAVSMNRMALETTNAKIDKENYAVVQANLARLQKTGVKPGRSLPSSLQEMRSYHLQKASGAQGGGTVRVQVGSTGILAATLVTGDESVKPMLPVAQHLKLANTVPTPSVARVLRDAVVHCSRESTSCDFVFMTGSGIGWEAPTQ